MKIGIIVECVTVYRKLSEIFYGIYAIYRAHSFLKEDTDAAGVQKSDIGFLMSMYEFEERFWYGHCFEDQRGAWG